MIDPRQPDFADPPGAPGRPQPAYRPADPGQPPAVSVVTPFFNTGPLFHETARSVLGQSLQQIEWLIVNDGSTSAEALAGLERYRADPRVRVIDHPRNRGLPAARNSGFAAARAPLVLQLDSDDLIEPTAAEVWAWHLAAHPAASFVKGYSVGFGAQGYLWREGFHTPAAFLRHNAVDATCLVRAAAHRAAGGYDEGLRGGLEDWDFWLRCADAGHWGATVPLFLNWYRRRDDHAERWAGLERAGLRAFRRRARRAYPRLWSAGMPRLADPPAAPFAPARAEPPFLNRLAPDRPAALLLTADFGEGSRGALGLARQLVDAGMGLTVAATDGPDTLLLPEFARLTPDLFALPLFLRPPDLPCFLAYLASSRRAEALLVAGSGLGALLLPALRAAGPARAALVALPLAAEESEPAQVGIATQAMPWADLACAPTERLRARLAAAGAEPARLALLPPGSAAAPALDMARELAASAPRAPVDPAVAALMVTAAVEWARLAYAAEALRAALAPRERPAVALLRGAYYRARALGLRPPAALRDAAVRMLGRRG